MSDRRFLSSSRYRLRAAVGFGLALLLLTGCASAQQLGSGVDGGAAGNLGVADSTTGTTTPGTVTLVTTNSFAISDATLQEFTATTGWGLVVLPVGSAGVLANQLVLTADHPLGDAFFGVDNTFASRLLDHGVTEAYLPPDLPASAAPEVIGNGLLIPVTQGDVCLNIDRAWFTDHDIPEPIGLASLIDPAYRGLTVVLNPAASSPGLAFLLATISYFDDDGGHRSLVPHPGTWQEFWRQLFENDVFVADSWSSGYFTDFSGAGEGGTRPIVVSYASSPASTITADGTESTTQALLNTCFRQVQYAGVLAGAANPEGARLLMDFLVGQQFQADLPTQMWVYPIDATIPLPTDWANFAPQATDPWPMDPAAIEANREAWLEEWLQIATR